MDISTPKIKNVLVTGGAGYIGNVVVRKLFDRGYHVRVLDSLIFGDKSLGDMKDKIELVRGDIRTVDAHVLDGIDAVIHLAGFSTEPTSQFDPRLTDMVNHLATERLALLAKEKGIERFVYASSCSVYFTLQTPLVPPLYKESDEINPISSYSITKRCAEQALLAMADASFHPVILRKGTLYGFSPRMRYDLVFNSFAKDAYHRKQLTVDAGGEIWRPMIDVQDAAEVYVKSIELPAERVGGKIFNVVSENWRIGDLAAEVRDILQKEKGVEVVLDVKPYGLTRNYKADASSFIAAYDFKPQRTMKDALLEFWDQFEHHAEHNPHEAVHYNDKWYREFFASSEGQKFRTRTV